MIMLRFVTVFALQQYLKKSNRHYIRGIRLKRIMLAITLKRITSCEIHHRDLALERQHSSKETSQRWRTVGDTVSDLTGSRIEPLTFRTALCGYN